MRDSPTRDGHLYSLMDVRGAIVEAAREIGLHEQASGLVDATQARLPGRGRDAGADPPEGSDVVGQCPYGCGSTLFLDDGRHVLCSYVGCPNPSGVDTLLADRESEHIVNVVDDGFEVRHPIRERIDGALEACGLYRYLRDLDGPPIRPGRYRARWDDSRAKWGGQTWKWETLPGAPEAADV